MPTFNSDGSISNYGGTQSFTPSAAKMPLSLADLVLVIKEAQENGEQAHAMGSFWSYSDCANTDGASIFTGNLNAELSLPLLQSALKPNAPPNLFYAQAGMRIREAYLALQNRGLAFESLGGQSGQTLAGAISTGTHGADFRAGALPDSNVAPALADSVLAIHLIGPGNTQFWVEPSVGVTDPVLLTQNVVPTVNIANVIYDDTIFNACLVALGSLGVIYAVLLRVRQNYDLIETTSESTWEVFSTNPGTWLNSPGITSLQLAVDPYPQGDGTHYCLIITRTEATATAPGNRPSGDMLGVTENLLAALTASGVRGAPIAGWFAHNEALSSDPDAVKIAKLAEKVLSDAPELLPIMKIYYAPIQRAQWPPATFRGWAHSVMDRGYGSPVVNSLPSNSFECFFPGVTPSGAKGFADFVNLALSQIGPDPTTILVGYIALRFTGKTRALLGQQQWNPTCAVEISTVPVGNIARTLDELANSAYSFGGLLHWGQMIDRGIQGRRQLYPQSDAWVTAFARIATDAPNPRMFANDLTDRWGLFANDFGGAVYVTTARTDQTWDSSYIAQGSNEVGMVAATSSQLGELQFLLGPLDGGDLWHTMRKTDGTWTEVIDVWQQVNGWPGSPQNSFAATCSDPQAAQFILSCQDGGLWRLVRQPDQTWFGREDVWTKIARPPGTVVSVAAASSGPGIAQFFFCTDQGGLWHTIRNSADGSWTGAGDVWGQIQRPASNVVAVAGVGTNGGEAQFIFCSTDGHLWHTLRHADGSWSGLGDVNLQVAIPWPVTKVTAADIGNGVARFLVVTEEGSLWMTDRNPDGSWTPIAQVNSVYLRIPLPVASVAAARDGAVGTASVAFIQ